mgnify:CR=1 FL=1
MVRIGYRTLKTAIGAGLAMWIVSFLDLEFATFAAIIAIMCMEKTKMKTILAMKDKFLASLLSLLLGTFALEIFGYHPIVFAGFILLFIPFLVKIKMQDGFVTSMVVLLHVYTIQQVSVMMFVNEITIIVIGMGIALLVNSFMPSVKKDIEDLKEQIEKKFAVILYEFSASLRGGTREWEERELQEVAQLINKAKSIAVLDVENHYLRKENKVYYYLEMRENQLKLLEQIQKIIAIIATSNLVVQQRDMFADFLQSLSRNVHDGNTTEASLNELAALKESIRQMDLPKVREEFEVRANLYYLIYEMENYLLMKKKLFAKVEKSEGAGSK